MDIVQSKKTGDEILFTLLEKANKSGLNVPSLDELLSDLKLDSDVKSHLKPAFELLASRITPEMHATQDQSSVIKLVSDAPNSMPEAYQNKYNSLRVLKEIFPDFNFGFENTHLNNNMIPLQILNQSGEKIKDYELAIEFDGKSLIFWKLLNKERVASRDIKVDFDKESGVWKVDEGVSIRPELSSTEAIELLRKNYPQGITDPNKIREVCGELNIDYDALINSIDVVTPVNNLTKAFVFVAEYYGPSLKMFFGSSSPNQFISNFFGSGSIKRDIALCLLKNQIWMGSGVLDLMRGTEIGTPYFKLLADGSFEMNQVRSFDLNKVTGDEIVTFSKDQATGMFIPYKDRIKLKLEFPPNEDVKAKLAKFIDFETLIENGIETDIKTVKNLITYLSDLSDISINKLADKANIASNLESHVKTAIVKLKKASQSGSSTLYDKLKELLDNKNDTLRYVKLMQELADVADIGANFKYAVENRLQSGRNLIGLEVSFKPETTLIISEYEINGKKTKNATKLIYNHNSQEWDLSKVY